MLTKRGYSFTTSNAIRASLKGVKDAGWINRQLLDFVSSITAPALFYLRASCPNESFYHLHPCKRPALLYYYVLVGK